MAQLEACPGCRALLPATDGPTHRYIGASAACWGLYTALHSGGEPPLLPGAYNALLVDVYAVQHPGQPSPQAIQSVAVHLLVLYGVLAQGVEPQNALWIRQQALSERRQPKLHRFTWLSPPDFAGTITIADIVSQPTPAARTAHVRRYLDSVWNVWDAAHRPTIAAWYDRFVLDRR